MSSSSAAAAFGLQESDLLDCKQIRMRLENTVHGCNVTVNLNGENSVLNAQGFGKRKGNATAQEKRFSISPLVAGVPPISAEVKEGVAKAERPPECTGGEEMEEAETDEGHEEGLDPVAQETDISASGSVPPAPVVFCCNVTLDTTEVQAKTTQELIDPDVEVMDVFDTAVVLRMTELTGDRFELTVYASGCSDAMGNAATLVHRGPIKSQESVHRIGQLEAAQVYVAWVRVFCEGQVRESKQKGFKTLPARVTTIWDEPDHVILGVDKQATSKEITKAFRQKSLQCHPDKETDPEKKDAAEEHMKRLNLAKSNMMKGARPDPAAPDDCETPTAGNAGMPPPDMDMEQASPSNARRQHRNFFGDDGSGFSDSCGEEDYGHGERSPHSVPKAVTPEDINRKEEEDKSTIGVSLKIEAVKPPKLQVIERHINSLVVEAFGLPNGGRVEVQTFCDDQWVAALPSEPVTAETMRFTLADLPENSCHRLRLRTTVELEPLRMSFAQFTNEKVSTDAPASAFPYGFFPEPSPDLDATSAGQGGTGEADANDPDEKAPESEGDVLKEEGSSDAEVRSEPATAEADDDLITEGL